ncbi:LysR substrate-binding domain-containing protein [Endobacterium cereale]|uniref:LysR substrate-binding domain-containing protein n=1 Tax=Endobacterium cereale TaxID=2663029 RepID=UPI002B4A8A1F|nr:LysR substrate-binding domain-containing protein [Endobacterium cereale]MEB2844199.1 LysR substrate-binding domain-containing protein [Endobacterium cereale]
MAAPKTPRAAQFELRHLRYFIALVEERNFERAAIRLGIAQPGLSQQIRNLETLVGLPLLDRRKRAVQLTPSGQMLFDEARKIVAQTDAALAQLRRVGRGQTGKISIGYVASVAYAGVLTESLSSFRNAFPDIELQLVEMEMRMQLNKIAEGELDFGYIRPPVSVPAGVVTMTVLREPLVVALPENHPLASVEEVDLAALSAETFITPRQPADVGFHFNTLDACQAAGFEPNISATGRDFTTIASMVAVGLGAAVGPQSLSCLQLPGVRYLQLLRNRVSSDLAVAYRKTEGSAAVRAFIAHQRAKYAQVRQEE